MRDGVVRYHDGYRLRRRYDHDHDNDRGRRFHDDHQRIEQHHRFRVDKLDGEHYEHHR